MTVRRILGAIVGGMIFAVAGGAETKDCRKCHDSDEHDRNAAGKMPSLQELYERSENKAQKNGQRDRDQDLASEIERRYYDHPDQNCRQR